MEYNVIIDRAVKDSEKFIIQGITTPDLEIKFSETNSNNIKNVFNELILKLKEGDLFQLKLIDNDDDIFTHVLNEYIKQLNSELQTVYSDLKTYELLNTKNNTN